MDCLIANTRDAFRFGQPNVLNYHGPNNPDTDKNRREACRNFRPIPPDRNSCDEYPYATTIQGGIQGGAGANIRAVNIGEQRRQGGDLSSVYRRIPPGTNGAFQVILVTPAIQGYFIFV